MPRKVLGPGTYIASGAGGHTVSGTFENATFEMEPDLTLLDFAQYKPVPLLDYIRARIRREQDRPYAHGGIISSGTVQGPAQSDTVPAALLPGERILPRPKDMRWLISDTT